MIVVTRVHGDFDPFFARLVVLGGHYDASGSVAQPMIVGTLTLFFPGVNVLVLCRLCVDGLHEFVQAIEVSLSTEL